MKLVTAIIKPFKLDDVRQTLADLGVQGVTVTEVKGFGRQTGPHGALSGRRIRGRLPAQGEARARRGRRHRRQAIEAITNSARTGKIGDGKIFVTELSSRWSASVPARPARKRSERSQRRNTENGANR